MGSAKEYSKRLGEISDVQFEAVAERWNLGRFIAAEPVTSGLFGQNVFVETTQGEFVLRGAPHWVKGPDDGEWRREDRWQFTKEVFFARQLRERTKAPVPWPMLHDETNGIFGWPYLVMPRMPGQCFDERSILKSLDVKDRRGVAVALGEMLAEMQTLTWPFAGDFDVTSIELMPYPRGGTRQIVDETARMMENCAAVGTVTKEDRAWFDRAAQHALAVAEARPNSYVHCDYKLNNLTVMKLEGAWRVTGLFDFHEARFAGGALDVVRQACSYLDTEPVLAGVFIDSYLAKVLRDPQIKQLMPLYVINDRMKFWSFFANPDNRAEWTKGKSFREWAQSYVEHILKLF